MIDTLAFLLIWSAGLLIGISLSAALGIFVMHLIQYISDLLREVIRK